MDEGFPVGDPVGWPEAFGHRYTSADDHLSHCIQVNLNLQRVTCVLLLCAYHLIGSEWGWPSDTQVKSAEQIAVPMVSLRTGCSSASHSCLPAAEICRDRRMRLSGLIRFFPCRPVRGTVATHLSFSTPPWTLSQVRSSREIAHII